MKKVQKKLIAILLSVILIYAYGITVSASAISEEISKQNIIQEKKALRSAHLNESATVSDIAMTDAERDAAKKEIYNALFTGQRDIDLAVEQLEDLGVYALESSIQQLKSSQNSALTRTDTNSINFNNVTIYYDSYEDVWELGCGGSWKDDSWLDDFDPPFDPDTGDAYNIGGADVIGILLQSNKSNSDYDGCYRVDSWAYVSAGDGELAEDYYNASADLLSEEGCVYEFQDYVYVESDPIFGSPNYIYHGNNFSMMVEYNSEFENYHGAARAYFGHTWDTSELENIHVSPDEEYIWKFDFTYVSDSKSFEIVSDETPF